MKRVHDDADPVGGGFFVAAGPDADNPLRFRIERLHGDVECRRVVGDPGFGLECGRRPFVRLPLQESGDRGRRLPGRVVQLPIDPDRGRHRPLSTTPEG